MFSSFGAWEWTGEINLASAQDGAEMGDTGRETVRRLLQ